MAFLILMPSRDISEFVAHIRSARPDIDLRIWPDTGEKTDIDFIVTWKHPPGALAQFPNVKAISSFGAGVDHILSDPDLPRGVPIVRIIDDKLIHDLREYVIAAVLNHKRHLTEYEKNQSTKKWEPIPMERERTVGVLGLGRIGGAIAAGFAALGFRACGWDRVMKKIPGVQCFPEDRLDDLLRITDYLICCLPLTPETKGILNRRMFNRLKRGAYVINVGRGDHLVEDDLVKAVEEGRLSGACLDVFHTEPLAQDHPFWSHPKITVTPHIASLTDPVSAAEQVIENYQRVLDKRELINTIDVHRGY
jgi:glyoxylate/hydroxypyruvate reductase A